MSAGGLSYSGIIGHTAKTTLPSVDSWGTNMNILRDPKKSIHTRRINKVGETSSITEMIDESSNRACEAISYYPRGVNPSVSVSYSNHGNNGGQRSGGLTTGGQQAAKLPYSIMKDGAFRPPVLLQEDLLPLSRMPRNLTSAYSQPGFVDFSRKMRTCGTAANTKEVRTTTLEACVRPTAVYQMETPIAEPFEVKYVIQPTLKTSAHSGMRTRDVTQRHTGNPTKEIDNNPLHARAQANYTMVKHVNNNQFDPDRYIQHTNPHHAVSNVSNNKHHVNNNQFDPDRYIQQTNPHHVVSNVSNNKHHTAIDDILDLGDMPVRDIRTSSHVAPHSGHNQTKYIHEDIELSRRLPEHHARTNVGDQNVHKRAEYENEIKLTRNMPMNSFVSNPKTRGFSDHGSRNVRLAPKIQPGGYSVPANVPMQGRMQNVHAGQPESEKAKMSRMVMESMQGRFDKPAPFGSNV